MCRSNDWYIDDSFIDVQQIVNELLKYLIIHKNSSVKIFIIKKLWNVQPTENVPELLNMFIVESQWMFILILLF